MHMPPAQPGQMAPGQIPTAQPVQMAPAQPVSPQAVTMQVQVTVHNAAHLLPADPNGVPY